MRVFGFIVVLGLNILLDIWLVTSTGFLEVMWDICRGGFILVGFIPIPIGPILAIGLIAAVMAGPSVLAYIKLIKQ